MRLPRRVSLGGGYRVEVILVPQSWFQQNVDLEDGEQLDGFFENLLGRTQGPAGRIYIHKKLPHAQKWATYWHEVMHAVHDIAAWDAHRILT